MMKRTLPVLLSLALIFVLPIDGMSQGTIIARPAGSTDSPWGFMEYLPVDYNDDPNKLFPVIIHLSGHGERGNGTSDLDKVTRHGPLNLIKRGRWPVLNQEGNPPAENFIVIGPQSSGGFYNANRQRTLIEYVLNTYRADPSRVYVVGLSAGGYGVWGVVSTHPDIVAAGIAIAGSGRIAVGNACEWKHIPVWAFHGDNDGQVGISGSLNPVNAVNSCNPPPDPRAKLTVYPGAGHNTWSRTYDLSGMGTGRSDWDPFDMSIYDWLLQYSKNSTQPSANAGPDQSITLPTNTVTMNGSGSDPDGSIDSYGWSKVSGPAATLVNADAATLTVQDMVEGTYVFELLVTDNDSNTATDRAQVVVNPEVVNQAPTVNAGSDITLNLPTNSTNIVSTASDTDGTVSTYAWSQRSGPSTATLSGSSTNTLTCADLIEGTYVFRITVTDDDGASAFDEVSVIVNPPAANVPPTSNAGANQTITLPTNSTTIPGSGSDSDGSVDQYLWEQINGPAGAALSNTSSPTLSVSDLVEGIYVFRLTVTDNDGATDSDQMRVTVLAANQNPTANAGTDITITLPTSSTTLSGSGSDTDGVVVSYEWQQLSGPSTSSISNTSNAVTNVSALIEGTYEFQLTVEDDDGAQDTDIIRVTVQPSSVNIPPTANAGPDISITLPTNSVMITGTGNDIDGTIASYEWIMFSGPSTFTLSNENTVTVTVTDLVAGTYILRLRVTDNDGATDLDPVRVNVAPETVNQAPIANAGSDLSITLPNNSVVINGSASDADGTVDSYVWTQTGGPSAATLTGENTADLTVNDLVEGIYTFELVVTDNDGATDTDEVNVNVNAVNQPPVVSAGPDVILVLPNNSVTIDGTFNDPDGTITTSGWVQVGGPATSFTSDNISLNLSGLVEATYVFRFSATDNDNATSQDDVSVFVVSSNLLPTVNAGPDITITLPVNSRNITAVANDSDGTIASYTWAQESGPSVTIVNPNAATVTLNDLVEGTYEFSVTVVDNDGGSASDNVIVNVLPATVNTRPVANAGPNQSITLPTNTINLIGSGSDVDGSVVSYTWTKRSGPAATLVNPNNSTLTLRDLVEGTYVFRLRVTDDDGASAVDNVAVFVNPEIVNQIPVANAGSDLQIRLPTNSTNIPGSGTDPDGTIVQYAWSQVNGPAPATLSGDSSPTLTANDLLEGVYTFRLEVTDDDGATDNDEMLLTVLAELANTPPIANAGMDQTITLPTNTVILSGSGSDPDGTVVSYLWTKVSGPATTLVNAGTNTLTATDLVEGTYEFRLTVTDDDNATAADQVVVQVLPATINQAPVVNAGPDIELILPDNNTQINGSATDQDGVVVSYAWTQQSGAAATLTNTDLPSLQVSDLTEGLFIFRLTATDDDGAIGSDEVNVNVSPQGANIEPIANAGADIELTLPSNSTDLDGSSSRDPDGTISSYSWEKVSGPAAILTNADQAVANVSGLVEGTYIFRLTVTDDMGATQSDDVSVLVRPVGINQIPIANAGPNIALEEPQNAVTIDGSGTDPDGTIVSYLWETISGPNSPNLINPDQEDLSVTNLIVGTYVFQLSVTDNDGATDLDRVRVTLNPAEVVIINDPPVADAGEDIVLTLPQNSVTLSGSAISESIVNVYIWRQVAGSPVAGLPADSSAVLLENLDQGSYTFQLTVADVDGQEDSDEVSVRVRDGLADNDFPRVFSPNADGINDIWLIDDLEKVADCSLAIYDKYGKKVYEANPYDNTWDGTFEGSELAAGAYYYVFKCIGATDFTGGVRIIR